MNLMRDLLQVVARGKLSVFLFHKVPPCADPLLSGDLGEAQFARLLDFIKEYFCVLPLGDAVQRLQTNTLPPRSAALTFDDGYPEWRHGAARLLEEKSLPATFFITTGQFFGHPMWNERLAQIVRTCTGPVLDTTAIRLPSLPMQTNKDKAKALQDLEFHFKYLPPTIRDQFLEQLEAQVGVSSSNVPAMSVDDLVTISNRGFEIGAHTLEHPILGLCDADRAREEIGQTREVLEGILKRPVTSFAYPNGHPSVDFSPHHIQMVKQAGYRYAVTTQWGVADSRTSPYQIPRFTPWGPSRPKMSLQLIRNFYSRPEHLKEIG
ncbi:MAG: polysaccharide deacetylase family protein [Rugosibacter sp.]|nr:MAG: polysaccharide deacetylase family protein [Rugosibacter sp.]